MVPATAYNCIWQQLVHHTKRLRLTAATLCSIRSLSHAFAPSLALSSSLHLRSLPSRMLDHPPPYDVRASDSIPEGQLNTLRRVVEKVEEKLKKRMNIDG